MALASPGNRSIEIFTDINHPASFSYPEKVLHHLREEPGYEKTKLAAVKKALLRVHSYTRFKPIRNKYPKMTTRSNDVDERWQLDLMNTTPFGPEDNDNFKFLLIVIDVFSRRLAIVPLYDKSGREVAAATELLFMSTGKIPKTISTDSGAEFQSGDFRSLCRKYEIRQFFTIPDITHASVVERVILTLRRKIGKYMLHNGTNRYLDALGAIVDGYNNSLHTTISMSPAEASGSLANRQIALYNLTRKLNREKRKTTPVNDDVEVGAQMRIPILPLRRFRKSHEPTFTEVTFPVSRTFVNDKSRPVARFADTGDRALKKLYFYLNELSKTE